MAPISPDHLARSFCALGATNEQLAELFGVAEATVEGWMANSAGFADAVLHGRRHADAGVANSLYQRAVGYSHRVERVLMGRDGPLTVSYTKNYPPHSKSCMDWLVNRRPDLWGRAAIKRKLQEADEARDAAARRPPRLSPQALAALVAAREEPVLGARDSRRASESYGPRALNAEVTPRDSSLKLMSEPEARGPGEYELDVALRIPRFYGPAPRCDEDGREVLRDVRPGDAAVTLPRPDTPLLVPA